MNAISTEAGLWSLAERLYPICRSITGNGLRQTLAMLGECVPLQVTEVPSGTAVFDWEVPDEWNIESARILDPDGRPVVDFADHNLHIVNYSEPVSATMPLDQLKSRLHVDHRNAQWIPYRTSYYQRSWGFCLPERDLHNLRAGSYRVEINSRLQAGSLSYGELVLPGSSSKEVLIFTHACHPTLAARQITALHVALRVCAGNHRLAVLVAQQRSTSGSRGTWIGVGPAGRFRTLDLQAQPPGQRHRCHRSTGAA